MDSDKKPSEDETSKQEQEAPADALSRTPDEIEEERAEHAAEHPESNPAEPAEKKVSPIKKFLRKVNVYLLLFILVLVVAGIIAAVSYLNSQKPADKVDIEDQALTEEALKQLSNTDATVGNTSQTLTIQGNAIISGETLMRGNLNVAGNFQSGGSIKGPSITISGESNLGSTQISSLQISEDLAVQGGTTMRDLNVAGASTFSGAVTASQLTVSRLILSGSGELQVPNHISFTGASPSRASTGAALGGGGSASVSGTDTAGTVNISTGGNTAAGCFIRIAFNQSFSKQPRVLISPIGNGAGLTRYYVDRDQSGFSICTSAPAPAHQRFGFDYFVAG